MDITYVQELGRGSFGSVWKVRDNNNGGKELAIKKMKYSSTNLINPTDLKEISYTHNFNHPNVVSTSYIIRSDGRHISSFIDREDKTINTAIELMDGSLEYLLRGMVGGTIDSDLLTEETIKSITQQIVAGLYYMNSCGYAHNDIKPANILYKVLPDNKLLIKLADFGLSEYLGIPLPQRAVGSGGTAVFKAPNSISDLTYQEGNRYSYKSDMFSVGATLLWIFTMIVQIPFVQFLKDGFGYIDISSSEFAAIRSDLTTAFTGDGYDFIIKCLDPNSLSRISSKQALQHPYIRNTVGGAVVNMFTSYINSIIRKPSVEEYLGGVYELEYLDDMYNNYKDTRVTTYIDLSSHTNVKNQHLELIHNWTLNTIKTLNVDNMDAFFTYIQYFLQFLSKKPELPLNKLQLSGAVSLVSADNLWANVFEYIRLSKIVEAMKGLFKEEQVVESQLELLDTLDFNLSFVPVTFFIHYWYLKSIYTHSNPEPNIDILTTSIALMSLLMIKNDDPRMVNISVDNMAKYCVEKAIHIQEYSDKANMGLLTVPSSFSGILDELVTSIFDSGAAKRASIDELKEVVLNGQN
jgi:serine/threonine protein kinase